MSNPARLIGCVALVLLGAGAAFAGPSILFDQIHGQPRQADFATVCPECAIEVLTADDYPIETILASGVVIEATTIEFTVPAGAAVLYGVFDCEPSFGQYPFITLYGPSGAYSHFYGHFHVENPPAGAYVIEYGTWEPEPTPYVVGTGPHFLTPELLAAHDVVVRWYDNSFFLLSGENPGYTDHEIGLLTDHVVAGGGNLMVRVPLVDIAVKPIIDLTAPVDLICDVTVALPGALTYAEPPCETQAVPGGMTATWSDVAVGAGQITRLAYEAALAPPRPLLEVHSGAATLQLRNHAAQPLFEVHLARQLADGRWELSTGGDLRPGETVTASSVGILPRSEARDLLTSVLHEGGLRGGLSPAQLQEFQGRYRWIDRLLDTAQGTGCWTALFRVGDQTCDAILPLISTPEAQRRARTLWFWVMDIPAGLTGEQPWPELPSSPLLEPLGHAAGPLDLTEYGVIRQRYPQPGATAAKDQDWFGWTFHDEVWLRDPVHNAGFDDLPWLITPGGHPDAATLLYGPAPIGGVWVGGVLAPWNEQILCGSEHAYTDDFFFDPGSLPPVVVATALGDGRVAAIASGELVSYGTEPNQTFVRRLLDWVARLVTSAADQVPAAHITRLEARPNPFNPRTEIVLALATSGPVRVTVHDAAGRRVAELIHADLAAGQHVFAWEGRTDRGQPVSAGLYLVRAEAAGEVVSRKVTLVD